MTIASYNTVTLDKRTIHDVIDLVLGKSSMGLLYSTDVFQVLATCTPRNGY